MLSRAFKNRFGPDIIFTHWMLYFKPFKRFIYKKLGKYGSNLDIRPYVTIVGTQNVEVGDNITLRPNTSIYADNNEGKKVIIGNDVLMGPNIYITLSNHNYLNTDELIKNQGHTFKDVIICDGAWIGYGVIILPGVTIGKHSVVAAGSVVSKDVLEYTVVGGVPAKVIKRI